MKKAIIVFFPVLFFFLIPSPVLAANEFTVTSFRDMRDFLWINGPSSCSASNSYVMTSPGNNQQSRLFACGDTFGSADNAISDGTYYIQLAVGGTLWKSQIFTIVDGLFTLPIPTATPIPTQTPSPTPIQSGPTPTPVNHSPFAVAATSINANGKLQLDGSLSSDPENDSLSYSWRIAGKRLFGEKVAVPDLPAGTYSVILIVGDNNSSSGDTTTIGITTGRPKATIEMSVQNILIDKKDGSFLIKGEFDKKSTLLNTISSYPLSRMLFELQTGGTTAAPIYGVTGESSQTLKTIDRLLKY
jgi:hypothetical protein